MTKFYAVVKENRVVFGPIADTEYAQVIGFLGKLSADEKKKCRVIMKQSPEAVKSVPSDVKPLASKIEPVVEKVVNKIEKPQVQSVSVNSDEFVFADVNATFNFYLEGSTGSTEFWKPKEGRNLIRILPLGGVSPADWKTPYPFVVSGLHANVGLSMQERVYCPRLTHNKPCPICAFVWKLWNSKIPDDITLARRIKSYKTVLANIVDLSDVEAGIQKYAMGKKLAAKVISYLEDADTKFVLHPEKGNNFILIKKTVDDFPNYDESRFEMKPSSILPILPDWRDKIHNLMNSVKSKSYEEMTEILKNTKQALLSANDESIASVEQPSVFSQDAEAGITEINIEDLDEKLKNF